MGRRAELPRLDVPATADTPENMSGGCLIVAPPGCGPLCPEVESDMAQDEREALPERLAHLTRARGVITATQIDRGPAVRRVLHWLEAAGINVQAESRSFALMTWPKIQHQKPWEGCRLRGAELVRAMEAQIAQFGAVCAARRPKLVVLLTPAMADAINTTCALETLRESLGVPQSPPRRLTDQRDRALVQRWPGMLLLALPVMSPHMTPEAEAEVAASLKTLFTPRGLA